MGVKTSIRRQLFSVICGNLLTISFGSTNGWASANFLDLQQTDTKLPSGPLSLEQATIMISISVASSGIGNLIVPFIVKRLGSKMGLYVLGFPQIISWLLIICAQNPYYFYVARILSGFVYAGLQILLSIFILEISHDHIRGTLISMYDPCQNSGIVFAFILAKFFDYVDQAKIHLIVTIVYMILFARIPESPQHLTNVQREKAANKAHKFFKGTELEKLPIDESQDDLDTAKLTMSDFTSRRAWNALFISLIGFALNAFHGFNILLTYVTEIFATTNPNISPHDASIIISLILILSNLIFVNLVDRAKRRTLYIWSSFGTAIVLLAFVIHLRYLTENHTFDAVPIVCLSFALFINCLGMNPIPFIVTLEILPEKIKNYSLSGCVTLMLTLQFFLTELYPAVKEQIGLIGWITFFVAMSLCNALYGIFYLPETKGKSYDEIMKVMDNL